MRKGDLKVGMKIIIKDSEVVRTVTAIGESSFIAKDKWHVEKFLYDESLCDWEPYIEPKKPLEIYIAKLQLPEDRFGLTKSTAEVYGENYLSYYDINKGNFRKFREVLDEE